VGRPTVAIERRRQILEAAIRCIAAKGLAGTTLDGIAEEAGMARGHVRHFAGNREDVLLGAAILLYFDVVPEPGSASPTAARGSSFLPADTTTLEAALDYLFDEFAQPGPENVAAMAFLDAARTNPQIHRIVADAYLSSQRELSALVRAEHPTAEREASDAVAYGVLVIALGNVFLGDVDLSAQRSLSARKSAEILIRSLAPSVSTPRATDTEK
jgi:TetR/AcrR family transcriptional repressor of bet genes